MPGRIARAPVAGDAAKEAGEPARRGPAHATLRQLVCKKRTNRMAPWAVCSSPSGTDRLPRRLLQLYAGLVLYGVSMALMVRSSLGVMPWDVLHQGLSRQLGWSLGVVTMVVGAAVLLAWVLLRERPVLGTLSNIVVIGRRSTARSP